MSAIVVGLLNVALGRYERPTVELKPGDRAPDFDLPGTDNRRYRLHDFRGRQRVVMAWFPKAFTGGCTRECESLRSHGEALRRYDVRYFAASVDDPETNRQFALDMGLDYPILSDADRRVARAYGVIGPAGFPLRWTFYIGEDGHILHIDKQVRVLSHGRDVVNTLNELGTSRL
jgi:peroxiredoxin Q/BCP